MLRDGKNKNVVVVKLWVIGSRVGLAQVVGQAVNMIAR